MMERFTYRGLTPEYVAPCALLADITIQIGSEPEPVKINSAIKKTLNHKPNPEVMVSVVHAVIVTNILRMHISILPLLF